MITSGIMTILHESIQIYDKLCDKNYLIVFGSRSKCEIVQLAVRQSYFWHLLGCKLESDTTVEKNNTYLRCKNKDDVSDKLSSIHSFSEIKEKYTAMKNVFDFVDKASIIRVCHSVNCPEEYLFKIGAGNDTGIIGYDYPNNGSSKVLFPKSAQLKSISKISVNSEKVLMILSKEIGGKYYNKIEYEIKKNVNYELLKNIPDGIKVSLSVNKS